VSVPTVAHCPHGQEAVTRLTDSVSAAAHSGGVDTRGTGSKHLIDLGDICTAHLLIQQGADVDSRNQRLTTTATYCVSTLQMPASAPPIYVQQLCLIPIALQQLHLWHQRSFHLLILPASLPYLDQSFPAFLPWRDT
jgi:hypothetical protein